MSSKSEWLKTLKVGDKVIYQYYGGYKVSTRVEEVTAITPKGFIKVNDVLFYPETGKARGDYYCCITEYTEQEAQRIKVSETIQKAFKAIRNTKKMNYNQAVQILEILGDDNNA